MRRMNSMAMDDAINQRNVMSSKAINASLKNGGSPSPSLRFPATGAAIAWW
ncbi:TPA: hypothetical protein SMI12_001005 [Serratia liquefaciens]|nr:hypothetical protein [Serratia liquefaciens]